MLLDNGQEVRPLPTLPVQGAHPFVNGNSEDRRRDGSPGSLLRLPLLPSPQVYMWVGTQTSQVEIKLSLKACQVSGRRGGRGWLQRAGMGGLPGLTPVLLPGVHPAHARQGARASPPPAPGPQGQRTARLYPVLPRLEHLPEGPGLGQAAPPAVLPSHATLWVRERKGLSLAVYHPRTWRQQRLCAGAAPAPSPLPAPVPAGVTLAEVHRALGS